MAIVRENGSSGTNGGEWTTGADSFNFGFTTTIGRLIVVTIIELDTSLSYVLAVGGTWSSVVREEDGSVGVIETFASIATSAVSSFTITGSDNGFGADIIWTEFSGVSTTDTLEDTSSAVVIANTNSASGNVTVTFDPTLLYGVTSSSGGADPTKDALFTSEKDTAAYCVAYRIMTSLGDTGMTSTLSAAENSISTLAAFNGAGSGPPDPHFALRAKRLRPAIFMPGHGR